MPVNRETAPVIVLGWLVVNSILGIVIASFAGFLARPDPLSGVLLSLMTNHIVGGAGALSGYAAGLLLPGRGTAKFLGMLFVSIVGTLSGLYLAGIVAAGSGQWYGSALEFWSVYSLPSMLLAILLCSTAAYLHREQWFGKETGALEGDSEQDDSHRSLKGNVYSAPIATTVGPGAETAASGRVLPFFSEGRHYVIPFAEIVYLSARKEGTLVCTTRSSYFGSIALAAVAQKLPAQFLQIHRSYIISLEFVSHFEYDSGGNYLVHLRDEEDSILPVSRSRAQDLKSALGLD
ncbi:MAG: LytTR family transcriptional regulator [Leptospiraceae bacterium]|nr:LytTR family transcriptional regulator [Leptospiraceae bacterium]